MVDKLEVSIDVIIHATEDISKFFTSFEEIFELKREDFETSHLTGHYENPITIMSSKMSKKDARRFLSKLLSLFSKPQRDEIMRNLEERIENSTLHIRLDKQKLIKGIIDLDDKDAVKLKISTPIYNKKYTIKVFSEILESAN